MEEAIEKPWQMWNQGKNRGQIKPLGFLIDQICLEGQKGMLHAIDAKIVQHT